MVLFFFNDTATTKIYTLSLHDALPICRSRPPTPGCRRTPTRSRSADDRRGSAARRSRGARLRGRRSEEHTSELQSRQYLVCRLLFEKKNQERYTHYRSGLKYRILH